MTLRLIFRLGVISSTTSQQADLSKWVRASSGYRASYNGIVDEGENGGLNFTDPTGAQAYGFRYTNSGVTTAPGVIGGLLGPGDTYLGGVVISATYHVSFDVVMDGYNGGLPFDASLVLFDVGASRTDVRGYLPGTAAALKRLNGNVANDGNYYPKSFSYIVGSPVLDNNGAASGTSHG